MSLYNLSSRTKPYRPTKQTAHLPAQFHQAVGTAHIIRRLYMRKEGCEGKGERFGGSSPWSDLCPGAGALLLCPSSWSRSREPRPRPAERLVLAWKPPASYVASSIRGLKRHRCPGSLIVSLRPRVVRQLHRAIVFFHSPMRVLFGDAILRGTYPVGPLFSCSFAMELVASSSLLDPLLSFSTDRGRSAAVCMVLVHLSPPPTNVSNTLERDKKEKKLTPSTTATLIRVESTHVLSNQSLAAAASFSVLNPTNPNRREVPSRLCEILRSVMVPGGAPFCAKCFRRPSGVK